MSGIYFLFQGGMLVYIGQSKDTERRLATHEIEYDSYRVIPCAIADLLMYEKRLINYFRPILNGNPGGKREGAGRKIGSYQDGKNKEETKVMRVPEGLLPAVRELIDRYNDSK